MGIEMQADIAGNRIVDACGCGKATGAILAAAHGDNIIGIIKKCYAVDLIYAADMVSDNGKIDALVVE